jgi:hypothetical protein
MNGQNFELEQIILIYACLQNMCDNHILYQFNIYIYIYIAKLFSSLSIIICFFLDVYSGHCYIVFFLSYNNTSIQEFDTH